jgi:hypothetical protein
MNTEPKEHGDHDHDLGSLGSLAQSARVKHLNTARWVLISIGILTILLNGFLLATMRQTTMAEIRKKNMVIVDQDQFEQGLMTARLIMAVPIALGLVFVVLGLLVKTYPVPITITALVLYVAATLAFGMLEPQTLAQGFIVKIIIVVALVKAVQAALAYQRELAQTSLELD